MSELRRPFFECHGCGEQTVLPYSTPEGKPIFQTGWPSGTWKRMFLCLQCGHVYVYSGQDVRWESFQEQHPSPLPKDVDVVCFGIPCATEGCKVRLEIHISGDVLSPNGQPKVTVVPKLASANFHEVYCSNGHLAERQSPLRDVAVLADPKWWID